MTGVAPASTDRRARAAVTLVFALNGFLAAMWVAHIPVITERTGVSHDQLGGLLLLLGGSAFVGMQVCGPLIDRWGSRPTTILAALALSAVILTPVSATNGITLAAALAGFGVANGALDVSMNAQAVEVERRYGRPIMSSFHGFFSIGGLVGSGIVALTLWLDVGPRVTVAAAAGFGIVVVTSVAGSLARRRRVGQVEDGGVERPAGSRRWWHGIDLRRLVLLAAVAFAVMLAEGTAYDWSALHVVETFGTPEALGAVAFGAFSAAMTIARFGVDAVATRFGPRSIVRVGGLIGIVGMSSAILAPSGAWAIVGWIFFGVGVAGLVPQIFTAAGNLTAESSGRSISVVVGCGYVGMLAGPAIVGFVSQRSSLGIGLVVAVGALAFAVLAADVVDARHTGSGHRVSQDVPH
ncbi:MFS transporter [Gordonia rhizosphera]|uniref:Putative major facilitator superfamily transporter n=1 Tax=Gordonia rhizosphera NBRC 16068 TaxID=1108045 RepID=K6W8X4_9ACTN|nr:MFS transporter [Gordonia rhizosphera]GAB90196.1 putative major facilitator superfamily transporter [Gordonia rhizosphera NBRC 16068]